MVKLLYVLEATGRKSGPKVTADVSLYDRPRVKADSCAKTRYERNEKFDYFKYSNNERVEYVIPSITTNYDARLL